MGTAVTDGVTLPMTEQTTTTPLPVTITPAPGSRLEQLLASYEPLKLAAEEAAARFEAVTTGIKAELTSAYPDTASITVPSSPGWPSLRLAWRTQWRFDVKAFKLENPLMYVTYSEQKGHWELRQAQ